MSPKAKTYFYPEPIILKKKGSEAAFRLLLLGMLLTSIALFYFVYRDQLGESFLLGLLGILSMIGVFYVLGTAMGGIQFTSCTASDGLTNILVDSLPEGTVVVDAKGRIVYANQTYARMTGATEITDLRTLDTILSDESTVSDVVYRLANSVRDGLPARAEIRLSHPLVPTQSTDNNDRKGSSWYLIKVRPITSVSDYNGPLFIWQIADISDERAEQERFFQDLQEAIDHLDHAPVGFFSVNPSGKIIYLNATLAEWLNIDLTKFVAGSMMLNEIVAGDGIALLDSIRAEPGTSRNMVIDLDLTKQNGQSFAARFYHSVQTQRNGTAGTSRTIVLDRTEGGETSAALRASEIRFTRFFNSAPMAIAAVNMNGKILRTNARFFALFSSIINQNLFDQNTRLESIVHERDREVFLRALAAAFAGQADISPLDTVLSNDEARHVRFYISPVSSAGDEIVEEAAIVSAVEITEQKALEGQMVQSHKMQAVGQLAGGIAHDFNNVLTAIIMSSDLLLSSHRASDPSFLDIMNIKQNANRAASLVRQLLAFSRRQTLRPEVLNLTDVMADLRMLLTRLVGQNVELKIDHGCDLWPVRVDLGQFEQVVVNLVVNARDAMPEGGIIIIRTRNVPKAEVSQIHYHELLVADYVLVEVEDNGIGIAQDVIQKIFEPFFTTKEVGKGTGLGLSMVYGIIKQTDGFIYCDSELQKGTIFKIFLPRYIEEKKHENMRGESNSTTMQEVLLDKKSKKQMDLSGSATVLLVEDEDAVRMGGVRALQSRGYTVYEASSGIEALNILASLDGKVDIVISDVVMPEMDGPTLLGELRKTYPDIKFVFVSGYAEDAFAKNLPADAQFGFLPKPFSLMQLATIVKDMLEKEDEGQDT